MRYYISRIDTRSDRAGCGEHARGNCAPLAGRCRWGENEIEENEITKLFLEMTFTCFEMRSICVAGSFSGLELRDSEVGKGLS